MPVSSATSWATTFSTRAECRVTTCSSREDLQRVSTTIAIAAEPSKAMAILGALRTGTIDVLATSLTNCLAIKDLLQAGH